ncbi:UNVERIFIED_CONTAM: hypothetical protein ABIC26_002040 [Paenibacillus sp. PvR008]
MEKVHNIFSILIGEFRNDTLNQNFTFVVAIAAGLLTISALVTIFILLNKQYIIQKCKELTWDIEVIINGNGKAYNKYELKSKFTLS